MLLGIVGVVVDDGASVVRSPWACVKVTTPHTYGGSATPTALTNINTHDATYRASKEHCTQAHAAAMMKCDGELKHTDN